MYRFITTLGILLMAVTLSTGYAIFPNISCTEKEMLKPLITVQDLIDKMEVIDADAQAIDEELAKALSRVPLYFMVLQNSCGEAGIEARAKLETFFTNLLTISHIIEAMEANDMNKAKEVIEIIDDPYILRLFVNKYGIDSEKMDRIIDVTKIMDNEQLVHAMQKSIINNINVNKIPVSDNQIQFLKTQTNKNDVEDEMVTGDKLNTKTIAKRDIPDCYKAIPDYEDETEREVADKNLYEGTFKMFSDNVFDNAYLIAMEVPCVHIQAIALKAIFDKIHELEIQNGVVAAKTYVLAKNLIEHEEIKKDDKSLEILNNIINNSTTFAKNVADGYICQDSELIQDFVTGEEIEHGDHNEYFVIYSPHQPEGISNAKFVEKADGELMLITVDHKEEDNQSQYSILLVKNDYPENLHLNGNVVSRKILGKESATQEEICEMNPKPQFEICSPASQLFALEKDDAKEKKSALFKSFKEHMAKCNES